MQNTLLNQNTICLIAAMSKNHVIGLNGSLPWNLPKDWENFKQVTKGFPFIMGRKSYDSPHGLYSEIQNIVLSSQEKLPDLAPNTVIVKSLIEAFEIASKYPKVFILGGERVFRDTLAVADYLYLTIVHAHIMGDTYFPEIDWAAWEVISERYFEPDAEHLYPFSINEYRRK